MRRTRATAGFTMVELLIVITLIGILATAVLSAINPVEQLRKGRDTSRKADAATLLSAFDRFQASFGCYPWYFDLAAGTCGATTFDFTTSTAIDTADFAAAGAFEAITNNEELKSQFSTRNTVTDNELYIYEDLAGNGQVSVCFVPESQTGRSGAFGPIVDNTNDPAAVTDCSTAYDVADDDCNVCVPQ